MLVFHRRHSDLGAALTAASIEEAIDLAKNLRALATRLTEVLETHRATRDTEGEGPDERARDDG